MAKKITALMILDGFGCSADEHGNAIKLSGVPFISSLLRSYPNTTIKASGLEVGLPYGQMGNSEVGHLNIGAGRVVYQDLTRISKDIEEGGFFAKKEFIDAMQTVKSNGTKLHTFGLISDGGVHSSLEHLYALLKMAKMHNIAEVYIHCFMDGRDVAPDSGLSYILELESMICKLGIGKIATVMGRYYAMDRDNRFERVEKAYAAMVHGVGQSALSAESAIRESYKNGVLDEFILPAVIKKDGNPIARIEPNDAVIFFNFRPDRAREITRAFTEKEFCAFDCKHFPVHYVCMTQYDKTFKNVHVAYKPENLKNTLGEYLAIKRKRQFRIAETEKYAHVTFFFNGGVEKPNAGEDRFLIPSPKVATYDLQPQMSAYEVTEQAILKIESGEYDVMILNFANPDMVGHTGVLPAAVEAVKAVDACVQKIVDVILKNGGEAIITADHGNAEKMYDGKDKPFTAHTPNPVPFLLVSERLKNAALRTGGRLADIAPTLLDLMGLEKPEQMSGKTLIVKQ